MTDYQFLNWLADRLTHVYGESENVDFVQRLRKMAISHLELGMTVTIPQDSKERHEIAKNREKG